MPPTLLARFRADRDILQSSQLRHEEAPNGYVQRQGRNEYKHIRQVRRAGLAGRVYVTFVTLPLSHMQKMQMPKEVSGVRGGTLSMVIAVLVIIILIVAILSWSSVGFAGSYSEPGSLLGLLEELRSV